MATSTIGGAIGGGLNSAGVAVANSSATLLKKVARMLFCHMLTRAEMAVSEQLVGMTLDPNKKLDLGAIIGSVAAAGINAKFLPTNESNVKSEFQFGTTSALQAVDTYAMVAAATGGHFDAQALSASIVGAAAYDIGKEKRPPSDIGYFVDNTVLYVYIYIVI